MSDQFNIILGNQPNLKFPLIIDLNIRIIFAPIKQYQMQHQELLHQYYTKLFPSRLICAWLSYMDHNPDGLLRHREFNFTMDINGQQVYERYISFRDSSEMRKMLLEKLPTKIDIGAVMQQIPKKGVVNTPAQREFVLDIDIDDYDNVRTCCKGAELCNLCWKLMRVACHVLYRAMYEDFGFRHMMFVFSGRRGLHLWVCDRKARQLEEYNRKSIMNYLYLVTGNSESNSQLAPGVLGEVKLNYNPKKEAKNYLDREKVKASYYKLKMHPFIRRSLEIIQNSFMEIFEEQNIMNDANGRKVVEKVLQTRSSLLLERVKRKWDNLTGSNSWKLYNAMIEQIDKYERFPDLYKNRKQIPEKFTYENPLQVLSFIEQEIQLAFMYPRLDVNVSTGLNHLLKCPFSVHPKSKRLSVPFKAESIDTFNPEKVVTIQQLIRQYENIENQEPERLREKKTIQQKAKLTSLNEAINVLEELVIRSGKENISDKLEF